MANAANPVTVLGLTDTRPWNDLDGNGLPLDANGNIQFNELSPSVQTPTFGRNVSTTTTDPGVLRGWGKRGYNTEYSVAAQHQIADRMSVNGGYYRRSFGNQTFTDDLRYDVNSYDSFCLRAPVDPDLPDGGGYDVCGVMDFKPSVFALGLPANNLIRFSDDFGGETNVYQGFDVNLEGRFRNGAFLKGGVAAGKRLFDNCNLLAAGLDAVVGLTAQGTETYPDGSRGCHREYPFRPDVKLSGSYTLPFDILIAGTYQFSRGVQTGGAGPSIQANWAVLNAVANPQIGRNWTGTASRTIQLIREGLEYGDDNLSQLDLAGLEARRRSDAIVCAWTSTSTTCSTAAGRSPSARPTPRRPQPRGCVRPTCCRAASSNWARSCRSDACQLPTTNAQLPTTPNFQLPNWELGLGVGHQSP